ncbi:flavodoxin family protein [Legionella busanensis]|nr:NAD(P)H-dependent oxidoreductase [Legionella busanensis]
MNKVIIFGSSRSFGNTRKVVDEILGHSGIELIDLNEFNIGLFDYEYRNRNDDFIPLIEKLIAYDTWIIATPVYWYSMSTQHKIFFDRFSDLLKIRKDLGRKLRSKKLFVIASFQSSYPRGFEDIFEQICEYIGMEYLGSSFFYSGIENAEFLQNNILHVEKMKLDILS